MVTPRFTIAYIIITIYVLLLPTKLYSQEQKEFVIGVEVTSYEPLWSVNNNRFVGVGRKILDAFAKSHGYKFTYRYYPIKRLFLKLKKQQIDFKFPDNPYWHYTYKGAMNISYSDVIMDYTNGLSVPTDLLNRGKNKVRYIGTVIGVTPWNWIVDIKAGRVKVIAVTNFRKLIDITLLGRIDGVYADTRVVDYHLKRMGKQGQLVFDRSLPHTQSGYLLSTTKHNKIIRQFDRWLIKNSHFIKELEKKDFAIGN